MANPSNANTQPKWRIPLPKAIFTIWQLKNLQYSVISHENRHKTKSDKLKKKKLFEMLILIYKKKLQNTKCKTQNTKYKKNQYTKCAVLQRGSTLWDANEWFDGSHHVERNFSFMDLLQPRSSWVDNDDDDQTLLLMMMTKMTTMNLLIQQLT